MANLRQARVGELIKRTLSTAIQREMRDPRLTLVSITNVEVAKDMTVAKVFVSAIGTEEDKTAAIRALQGASGMLRGILGKELDLRTIPALAFRQDEGVEKGIRMFELLKEEERLLGEMHTLTDSVSSETPMEADAR